MKNRVLRPIILGIRQDSYRRFKIAFWLCIVWCVFWFWVIAPAIFLSNIVDLRDVIIYIIVVAFLLLLGWGPAWFLVFHFEKRYWKIKQEEDIIPQNQLS